MIQIARQALFDEKAIEIKQHLQKMKNTASTQFQTARIEGKSLEGWLISLVDNDKNIWNILKVDKSPSIEDIKPENEKLALEYTVRLIVGVLHKAIKESNNE
jgi:hypothetical protein